MLPWQRPWPVPGLKLYTSTTTTIPWAKPFLSKCKCRLGQGPCLAFILLTDPSLLEITPYEKFFPPPLVILTRALDGPRVFGWTAGNRKPPNVCATAGRLSFISEDTLREGSGLRLSVIKPGRMGRGGPWSSGMAGTGGRLKCKETLHNLGNCWLKIFMRKLLCQKFFVLLGRLQKFNLHLIYCVFAFDLLCVLKPLHVFNFCSLLASTNIFLQWEFPRLW